jgi:hypothetical protein
MLSSSSKDNSFSNLRENLIVEPNRRTSLKDRQCVTMNVQGRLFTKKRDLDMLCGMSMLFLHE